MYYDVVILGAGPAGCSAALTLRQRGKTAAVISCDAEDIPLYRSEKISNYPGCPDISGKDLLETMHRQLADAGVDFIHARAGAVMPFGKYFGLAAASSNIDAGAVIVATGVGPAKLLPGEREHIGKGVSYCVTCDGRLYKNKDVCVLGFLSDSEAEAEILRQFGCRVTLFTDPKAMYVISGRDKVDGLMVNGRFNTCDAVFILRPMRALDTMILNLETEDGHVKVDRRMATNIPGLFAAGDCTGGPYQIAKAAGEGNIAALSASSWLDERKKQQEEKKA